ncbi:hypothetical protein Tco_0949598 [Tanacetum coccineum]
MMNKMKEGYRDGEVTPYTTQVFSVNNWALKPNQPGEPLFIAHMLAIYNATEPVVFKAPNPSSNVERVPQGTKSRAQPGHKKHSTSLKQPSVSSKETTKGGSSKAPTSSKTGPSKKRKEFSLAIDSNPSQPTVSTPVDTRMHKEDQQATGGPTSLGVTSKGRANPQLSSDQTKSVSKGLKIVLTQPTTRKWASSIARQIEEESSRTIKLEDLAKLVSNSQKHKLELEKNKSKAKVALLKAQPSFPNVGQLNELLVASVQAKLKTLDALRGLLLNVTKALNKFAQVLDSSTSNARDQSVPSAGQADTMPVEREKNTNQATISQLFQRRAKKNAET